MELRLDVRSDGPAALVPLDARRVGYDEVGRIGWVGIGRLGRPFRSYRDDLATGRGRRFSRQTE